MRKLETREIIVATHNAGKLDEINFLIQPFGFSAKGAAELNLPEPEETGTTFEENALIKALSAVRATGIPSLADDSGLCVSALDDAPGVHTADWAEKEDGSGRDFPMAMEKVETAIIESQSQNRNAKFVAVLCLAWPDEHVEYFRGEIEGDIIWPPRGDAGFGYDPIFMPNGHERSFGEMTAEEKHGWNMDSLDDGLSHRARAFSKFAKTCLSKGG